MRLRPDVTDIQPGQLVLAGKSVVVGTGSHAVELTNVQPAGKKMMAAADWARGQSSLESVVFQ
ncbi:methionyl-tRNA formyltransferase [Arthrobacter sp. OAP107]